jgi:hypothetical protein
MSFVVDGSKQAIVRTGRGRRAGAAQRPRECRGAAPSRRIGLAHDRL